MASPACRAPRGSAHSLGRGRNGLKQGGSDAIFPHLRKIRCCYSVFRSRALAGARAWRFSSCAGFCMLLGEGGGPVAVAEWAATLPTPAGYRYGKRPRWLLTTESGRRFPHLRRQTPYLRKESPRLCRIHGGLGVVFGPRAGPALRESGGPNARGAGQGAPGPCTAGAHRKTPEWLETRALPTRFSPPAQKPARPGCAPASAVVWRHDACGDRGAGRLPRPGWQPSP